MLSFYDFKSTSEIQVLADWQLSDQTTYHKVWQRIRQEYWKFKSRRQFLGILFLLNDYDGGIIWPDGSRFVVPDLIKLFPDDDNRWLSTYLQTDETGVRPRRRVYRKDRVRVLYLYCQIVDGARA